MMAVKEVRHITRAVKEVRGREEGRVNGENNINKYFLVKFF